MSTSKSFRVLIVLHSLSLFHNAVKEKKLKLIQLCLNGTLIGWDVQHLRKTWRQVLQKSESLAFSRPLLRTCGTMRKKFDVWFFEAIAGFVIGEDADNTTIRWLASTRMEGFC